MPIRQCPIISDFMLKVSKFALFTCCREMQVEIDIVDSNDNNFVNIFSFNNEIKNYEVKENLVFFESVQNALLRYAKTA